MDRWESMPLFETQRAVPAEQRAVLRAGRLANEPASLAAALRGLGTGALPSLWARLADFTAETLLLVGSEDAKFADVGRRMAKLLPRAEVAVVGGCGHAVHFERPDAWVEVVTDFLGRR